MIFFPVAHFLFSFEIFSFNCFPIAHALWFISQLLVRIKLKMHSSTSYFLMFSQCLLSCYLPTPSSLPPTPTPSLCLCSAGTHKFAVSRACRQQSPAREETQVFISYPKYTHKHPHTHTNSYTHTHSHTWYASVYVSLRLRAELLLTLVRRWDKLISFTAHEHPLALLLLSNLVTEFVVILCCILVCALSFIVYSINMYLL